MELSQSFTLAIVMSRLPRLLNPDAIHLRALRVALRHVQQCRASLLIGDRTAGCELIRRGAERLGIEHTIVSTDNTRATKPVNELPIADRMLIDAADMVLVLGLRAGGNLHRLLLERLLMRRLTKLVDLPGLQPPAVRDELLKGGAHFVAPALSDELPLTNPAPSVAASDELHYSRSIGGVCEIVPFPERDDWTFLSHTTRSCASPWPGQSLDDYLDSLLDGRSDADHSAVATLSRLISDRRLIASEQAIRGQHRVVCFTAVPLLDLPGLHRFRSHRGRWDFEPFGLCVRRDWLQQHGARPVIYGDESIWRGLTQSDRPYFQLAQSRTKRGKATDKLIDWTQEREWRHQGDIDLSDLPPHEGLVFVPDYESARRIAAISPWPVTLWPDPKIVS